MAKTKPTQSDVAKLAGVSRAMVSYVLNNKGSIAIPDTTRQRILDAIDTLGYLPDRTAQSLRTRKTYTVATIIPDITNPYYPILERAVQDVAKENDYDHIIYNTDGLAEEEQRCLRSAWQKGVDGVIGSFFHLTIDDFRPLLEAGIPVVQLASRPEPPHKLPLDTLYVDNVAAAQAAVNHLVKRGHQTIATIAGPDVPVGNTRLEGYLQAMQERNLAVDSQQIVRADFTDRGGYQAMQQLLQVSPRPTAVFAANDMMALGALLALREAGLRIPQEMAIVGFDDLPVTALIDPPLTTISQFQREIGRRGAEMIFERLNGLETQGSRCEEVPFQLIVRASA